MLYLIQNHHRAHFKAMLDDMHEKRYEVFYKRLGWQIPVQDGKEIDQYDIPEAFYLLNHSKKYGVCGGLRLMPTTGTNMLRDTFSHLVDTPATLPNSSAVWDITRLFFMKPQNKTNTSNIARRGTLKIMVGAYEFALSWGIKQLVCVTTLRVEKLFRNMGWQLSRLGVPQTVHDDPEPVVALSMDINEQNLINVYRITGISCAKVNMLLPFSIQNALGFPAIAALHQQASMAKL